MRIIKRWTLETTDSKEKTYIFDLACGHSIEVPPKQDDVLVDPHYIRCPICERLRPLRFPTVRRNK